jgi:hypothetical protein
VCNRGTAFIYYPVNKFVVARSFLVFAFDFVSADYFAFPTRPTRLERERERDRQSSVGQASEKGE